MFLTEYPEFYQGPIYVNPGGFFGDAAVAGASYPWLQCPLGYLYVRINAGNVKLYIKTANNAADADWQFMNVT